MKDEMRSINRNQIRELTSLLEGKRAVGLNWIFKSKYNGEDVLHKRKARIVAKGYSQKESIDFNEVLKYVARIETIWMFLAI